jgi:pimeloyl-ACP methyl ester carboxylesterase
LVAEWVLRERFVTGAGAIAWDRLGEGPPVVMVHGTPWSSWTWRRVAPRLAERFSVYVFDLLGFGASDQRGEQDVSLAAHGARLAALLEYWRLDRPAVIAHDIGGATALRAHLLHHRPVTALALIDVVALAPWGSPFYRLVRDHWAVFDSSRPRFTRACCVPMSGPRSRGRSSALSRTPLSRRGSVVPGSRRSTGRSPTAISGTPTRSSRCMAGSRRRRW